MKNNCIICNKLIDEKHMGLITCRKECSKIYNRISPRVFSYLFKPRRCIICRHQLDIQTKRDKKLVCNGECSDLFNKIVNTISNDKLDKSD